MADDYLVVQLEIRYRLGPDSLARWPEEKCEKRAQAIASDVALDWNGDGYSVYGGDWHVKTVADPLPKASGEAAKEKA